MLQITFKLIFLWRITHKITIIHDLKCCQHILKWWVNINELSIDQILNLHHFGSAQANNSGMISWMCSSSKCEKFMQLYFQEEQYTGLSLFKKPPDLLDVAFMQLYFQEEKYTGLSLFKKLHLICSICWM